MRGFKSRIDIGRLAELREERGWSVKRIAAELGISPGAVSWQCLRHGIEHPGTRLRASTLKAGTVYQRCGYQVRPYTPEEDAVLSEMALARASNSEIARRLGRKPNSIAGRLMTLARREAIAEEAA